MSTRSSDLSVSAAILTMGNRPVELARAVASVRAQRQCNAEIVIVVNGESVRADPESLGVDLVHSPVRNLGIPGGRNVAAELASGDLILFLDDDAELLGDTVLARACDRFNAEPSLAAIALRIIDPDGHTAHRHVPRVGGRSAGRSGYVAAFLGGAVIMRARAFEQVGGYDGELWYAMEETDLSWRMIDRGWDIWYDAAPAVEHPRTEPSRHPGHVQRTARNRVRIAWRSLPVVLVPLYLGTWFVIALARRGSLRAILDGLHSGWVDRPHDRDPMRWRTVLRLARLGRPPII